MNGKRVFLIILLAVILLVAAGFLVFLKDEPEETVTETKTEEIALPNVAASVYAGSYAINDENFGTMVTVVDNGNTRTFTTNEIPNHETGAFPNATNPNTISEQDGVYTMTANPEKNSQPTTYNVQTAFGIAYNGVVIDRYAAEWYLGDMNSGWQLAGIINDLGFDKNNAHVQPDGTYHYHGIPTGLVEGHDTMQLIGFAADGFPIYAIHGYKDANDASSAIVDLKPSYQVKSGTRPNGPGGSYDGTYEEDWEYKAGLGDLDKCNAREGVTPEFPEGTLYYALTDDYPFVPLCFWGDINDSFLKMAGSNQMPPGDTRPPTP